MLYKVDSFYTPKGESGIRWDDPELAIKWPVPHPLVAPRDQALPSFADFRRKPPVWA
jgi:dTDP-4-dehydrorhamnose 3,5-epimerase